MDVCREGRWGFITEFDLQVSRLESNLFSQSQTLCLLSSGSTSGEETVARESFLLQRQQTATHTVRSGGCVSLLPSLQNHAAAGETDLPQEEEN